MIMTVSFETGVASGVMNFDSHHAVFIKISRAPCMINSIIVLIASVNVFVLTIVLVDMSQV